MQPLPAISVPNNPALLVAVDTSSCTVPHIAGGPGPCFVLQEAAAASASAEQLTLQTSHAVISNAVLRSVLALKAL
jgi:hypothetical protein